ncbi:MAG: cation-translocating P-type ATPase [Thermodesulfobacteriota bacterium]
MKRYLEDRISHAPDVQSVSASALTGNILVCFNSNTTHQDIADLIGRMLGAADSEKAESQTSADDDPFPVLPRHVPEAALDRLTNRAKEGQFPADDLRPVPWHVYDPENVLGRLRSRADAGLTRRTAELRLKKYGPNRLPKAKPRSGLEIFLGQFSSLPVALLGAAAALSALTGGLLDAAIIAGVVTANAAIGFYMESRAERTIHALKVSTQPLAEIIRQGMGRQIQAEGLVPGDILVLKPGTQVPADCRIVDASQLSIDESALTGESLPVLKGPGSLNQQDTPLADRNNMAYMGTLVTGGAGLGVVTATGPRTEMGRLQILLESSSAPDTPIERQLRRIGNHLVYLGAAVGGLVFIIGLLRGFGLYRMSETAISVAAAAVPEGLPTTATITFALGISNMKRRHVIIRQLQAVETLGTLQTVCLDKTGTITENRMTVLSAYAGKRPIEVREGRCLIDGNLVEPGDIPELEKLLEICVLCNESRITGALNDGALALEGSSTENALVRVALESGIDVKKIRKAHPLLDVKHRAEKRLFMATVHKTDSEAEGLLAVKGSPVAVLDMCDRILVDGRSQELDDDLRMDLEVTNSRMAGQALRVLGVACKPLENGERNAEDAELETGLTFVGFIGMADPVRDGVRDLIRVLHRAGINTVMITGDQSPTAHAVAKHLGLSQTDHLEILDSTQLMDVDPAVMEALAGKVHVYSRVTPAHKLQIVRALQAGGRVVAMTGDGINDGPALKAADIGIAMGKSGTDIAREVADVVLEEDNLETLIVAIRDGRTIHRNIKKSVHFFLATNLTEILMIFSAISTGLGIPLNTMQLLWINLISDIFPGIALSMEAPEADVMDDPPRDPEAPLFSTDDYRRIGGEAAAITGGALASFLYGRLRYGAGPRAGSLAFQSLTVGQLLHALSCRSETRSVLNTGARTPNRYLDAALGGSLLLQLGTLVIPGLRKLLGLSPLVLIDLAVAGGGALAPLLINEMTKPSPPRYLPEPSDSDDTDTSL